MPTLPLHEKHLRVHEEILKKMPIPPPLLYRNDQLLSALLVMGLFILAIFTLGFVCGSLLG